ncbi:MAG: 3-deoxy-8-phosphooctulonate synthase [Bacteroidia bacterium]|nr:3-deoxy-8-phosphooctulonate synthase [Bacteroidia bacterium]
MKDLYQKIKYGPFIIAGPCVIESQTLLLQVGEELARLQQKFGIPVIFKSSFDKANRTSISSFRGPGLEKGLEMLQKVKDEFALPITTDIHEAHQALPAAEVVDILQIPAFLCRQTDLLLAAGNTDAIVNIKKAQFLGGEDMKYPAQKVASTGNEQLMLTERGNMFGYQNLVVDFRNIPLMKEFGYPVVMDCTHSVQRPGAAGGKTGGDRQFVPSMAYAAKAFGVNGYFFEVHPDPTSAKSDGPNMLYLKDFEQVIYRLLAEN